MQATEITVDGPSYSTRPRMPDIQLFAVRKQSLLLQVEVGSIYAISPLFAAVLDQAIEKQDFDRVNHLLDGACLNAVEVPPIPAPSTVRLHALSLAVAQKCNFGCTYCYAQQGTFGGSNKNMELSVAKAAVEQLLSSATAGQTIELNFLGGEPLMNRPLLQEITRYAVQRGHLQDVTVRFSLTTNGSLLREEDISFFNQHNFAITISMDGREKEHNELRPLQSGVGSYQTIVKKISKLLAATSRKCRLTARLTVTPQNMELPEYLELFTSMGFDSVQFSPLINAPNGKMELAAPDFELLLHQMVKCGQMFEQGITDNRWHPFSNLLTVLKKIHHYQHNTYPCGAGGGYMGVSADGDLFACHRFVNDEKGAMGNVFKGVDAAKQASWLRYRHVAEQTPCSSCWARYICSGSCHHEVIYKGRPACDYIRGWIQYCLSVYTNLALSQPAVLQRILTTL